MNKKGLYADIYFLVITTLFIMFIAIYFTHYTKIIPSMTTEALINSELFLTDNSKYNHEFNNRDIHYVVHKNDSNTLLNLTHSKYVKIITFDGNIVEIGSDSNCYKYKNYIERFGFYDGQIAKFYILYCK